MGGWEDKVWRPPARTSVGVNNRTYLLAFWVPTNLDASVTFLDIAAWADEGARVSVGYVGAQWV